MRIEARTIIVTTGVVGLIGSALAADMTGAEIKISLRQDRLSGDHAGVRKRASRSRRDLLGRGWHGPLQDPEWGHHAWQVGGQGQHELHRLEGEAEHCLRAL